MNGYEDAGKVGKDAMDGAMRSLSAAATGFQQIAAETTDFTKRSFEESARMFEQLAQARSVEKAMELQGDFAKSAYQSWISQATRMGELYADIAKQTCKPLEHTLASAMRAAQPGVPAA